MSSSALPSRGAPWHADGVVLRQTGDRNELVDRRGTTVHTLNGTALALWELCDGETTPQEMADAALTLFDADPLTVEHDIAETLRSLTLAGLLQWPTAGRDQQEA